MKKTLLFTLVIGFCFVNDASAKQQNPLEKLFPTFSEFKGLTPEAKASVIQALSESLIEIEAKSPSKYYTDVSRVQEILAAASQLILPEACAYQGDRCVFAGHIQQVSANGRCAREERCDLNGKNDGAVCNPLLFGPGVCVGKDQLGWKEVTAHCARATPYSASEVAANIQNADEGSWNQLRSDMLAYCQSQRANDKNACEVIKYRLKAIELEKTQASSERDDADETRKIINYGVHVVSRGAEVGSHSATCNTENTQASDSAPPPPPRGTDDSPTDSKEACFAFEPPASIVASGASTPAPVCTPPEPDWMTRNLGFSLFQKNPCGPSWGASESDKKIAKTAKDVISCVGAQTDREKARAIYDWIVRNIDYHYEGAKSDATGKVSSTGKAFVSSDKVFENKKGICAGYRNLYLSMAEAVGLEAEDVTGDVYYPIDLKDANGNPDPNAGKIMGPHAWVKIILKDEKTEFYADPTWGAVDQFAPSANGQVTKMDPARAQEQRDKYFGLSKDQMNAYHNVPADKASKDDNDDSTNFLERLFGR